jgi:hypothetical protein
MKGVMNVVVKPTEKHHLAKNAESCDESDDAKKIGDNWDRKDWK